MTCRRRRLGGSALVVLIGGAWAATTVAAAPAAAATILVRAGGNLQEALNGARGGDAILLEAGATFVGNFVLPARSDAGEPVTVRTSASGPPLPSELRRVTPAVASLLPKLRSPNREPALRTAPGARGWRIVLVEFVGGEGGTDILRLGDGGSAQSTLASVPRDIVIDRCYLHADAPGQKRGIALNSATTTIKNCWIAGIRTPGQDSQAITGWNGPGPFEVLNNYLEAAGQGFMLGGADAAIQNLVPTGLRFSGNHVTRPAAWRTEPWQVKNLFELKNARDAWIEGNLFENNWRAAQSGYAILFTPRNQDGAAPWSTVENVHFRYNVVRHAAAAISLLGRDSPNPSGPCRDVEISNNLFYDVDGERWGGNGDFILVGDGPANLRVEHNTVVQSGKILSVYGGTPDRPSTAPGLVFRDNLVRHNAYGVHGSDHAVGRDSLDAYFPSAVFTGNLIGGGSASVYPPGNSFISPSAFDRLFVDANGGDYHLVGASAARAGGRTVGANIDQVIRAWRAAQEGEGHLRLGGDREPVRRPKGTDRE